MTAERTCATCAMADVVMTETGPAMECHRFPPVSHPTMAEQLLEPIDGDASLLEQRDEILEVSVDLSVHRFPHVQVDDWCGEWRAER